MSGALGTVDFVKLNLLFGTVLLAFGVLVVIGHRTKIGGKL